MPAKFDSALIGKLFEMTEPVLVTADSIRQFCAALREDNPRFTNERAGALEAPPSFAVTFRNSDNFARYTPKIGFGFDAGKEAEFVAPIRAGDRITLSSAIREMYEKTGRSGTMLFTILRSTLTNQRGETVAHIDHRFVHRDPPAKGK